MNDEAKKTGMTIVAKETIQTKDVQFVFEIRECGIDLSLFFINDMHIGSWKSRVHALEYMKFRVDKTWRLEEATSGISDVIVNKEYKSLDGARLKIGVGEIFLHLLIDLGYRSKNFIFDFDEFEQTVDYMRKMMKSRQDGERGKIDDLWRYINELHESKHDIDLYYTQGFRDFDL